MLKRRGCPSKGRTWPYICLLPSSTLFGTYKYIQVINSNSPYFPFSFFSDYVWMFLLTCLIGLGLYCCRKPTTNISLRRLRDFWECWTKTSRLFLTKTLDKKQWCSLQTCWIRFHFSVTDMPTLTALLCLQNMSNILPASPPLDQTKRMQRAVLPIRKK